MNDYTKYDFYSFEDKKDKKRHYFIKIHNNMVEVNKDVYYVCYNSYRKQIRDNRRDETEGLISYDVRYENGYSLLDTIGIDDEVSYDQEQLELVINAINELSNQDKEFVIELFIKEQKEKELAEKYHVKQQSINKRKKRIIKKIQKKIKKGC